MKPEDTTVIDGTKPSEGGDITVEHLDSTPTSMPGATISPTKDTDLKPFNDHLVDDIDKANHNQELSVEEGTAEAASAGLEPKDSALAQEPATATLSDNPVSGDFNQQQAVVAAKGVVGQAPPPQPAQNIPPPQQAQNTFQAQPSQNVTPPQPTAAPMQSGMYSTDPAQAGIPPPTPIVGQNNNSQPNQFANNGAAGGVLQPVVGGAGLGGNNINAVKPNKPKKSKKKLLLILLPILLIFLIGGLVFGVYLPNTPENVWKTGMSRTGQELTALVEKLEKPEELNTYEKAKITVTGEVEQDGEIVKLNFDSLLSDTKSDSNFNVKTDIKDADNLDISADIITDLPEGARLPNTYFKISGLSQFGLDEYIPNISKYEDKWVAIEQDFINQLNDDLSGVSDEAEAGKDQEITYDDVMTVVNDANSAIQQYIFTADPEFAVIQMNEFVGTEESEGIKANHYMASVNKENYKKFCSAFIDKLAANKVIKQYANISDEEYDRDIIETKEDCVKQADEIESDETFDIWFDKKYKLFHKVRLYDDVNAEAAESVVNEARYSECLANNAGDEEQCQYLLQAGVDQEVNIGEKYSELGQVYKGGDDFMFFIIDKNESNQNATNARLELNINTSTLAFNGVVTSESKSDYGNTKINITMASEPYDGDINAAKPSGAVPMRQMIKDIFGYDLPVKSVAASARDAQRKSDISSLHTALESYYIGSDGTYPSLKEMNDIEFRNVSLRGIPEEVYIDPAGSNARISDRVGPNVYAYVVVPANCDGNRLPCEYYELSATLDDGSLYTKTNTQ